MARFEFLRRQSLVRLRDAYAAGHLNTGTLEVRLGTALRARSRAELDEATWDLPRLAASAWEVLRDAVVPRAEPPVCHRIHFRVPGAPPIPLDGDEPQTWLIGRSRACDIRLGDRSVSRRHALVSSRGAVCVIRDLDSTNGLLVNGTRVSTGTLHPRDVVTFGGTVVAEVH